MHEFLTPAQMYKADKLTIAAGVAGIELMEAAGQAICDVVLSEFSEAGKILIICGNGNNGGDGLIAARILSDAGLVADLYFAIQNRHGNIDEEKRFSGDAKLAWQRLPGKIQTVAEINLDNYDLIIDAIFGAGLDGNIEGHLADLIADINHCPVPVLAVDLPSGIEGAGGSVLGVAIEARATVTFFRHKPAHILFPGREYCGKIFLKQIGIPASVLAETRFEAMLNHPDLWISAFPRHRLTDHKYSRGNTLVVSADLAMSGAARLAASAALRSGSGLVTIASSKDTLAANAAQLTTIMLQQAEDSQDLVSILRDPRINCVAMGPGMAPDQLTQTKVLSVLRAQRSTVLDAGALSAFVQNNGELFSAIHEAGSSVVLTPHEGEFSRLFPKLVGNKSKIERARLAAEQSGAVIILKGPDTVVASPSGRICIANNAPSSLATAGSGDVLTGIVAGFLAQAMPVFEAAASAVWIHGDAANRMGPPLISSDLDLGLHGSISALLNTDRTSHDQSRQG